MNTTARVRFDEPGLDTPEYAALEAVAMADPAFVAAARCWLAGRDAAHGVGQNDLRGVGAMSAGEVVCNLHQLYHGGINAARAQLATAATEQARANR